MKREYTNYPRFRFQLDKGGNGTLPPSALGSSDKDSSGNSRSLVPSILASSDRDSSVGSAGGLSWQGSFDQATHEENRNEEGAGLKRTSSGMKPGGATYEKGKWVSEYFGTWITVFGRTIVLTISILLI